jgi:WD40 repeat protein
MNEKVKAVRALALMLGACAGAWIYPGQSGALAADKGETTPAPRRDHFGDPLPPGALARMGTVRFRHGGTISSFALSPDDRILVTASSDHTVRLWDVATGREVRRLVGYDAAFSADGKLLATRDGTGNSVHLWDAATGKELRNLQDPRWWVLGCLALSADGKMVAAGVGEHRIAVWDCGTGRLLHHLDGGEKGLDFPVHIAFSPDGRLLASGGLEQTIYLWDMKTGKEQRRFTGQPSPRPNEKRELNPYPGLVCAVAFSPEGRLLASSALKSPVRLWDVVSGKEVRSLKGDWFGAVALAFSADGKMLATGEVHGVVRVWETATGREVCRIQAHKAGVYNLVFFHDGKSLATSGDGTIRLWEIRSGAEITPDRGHSTGIVSSFLSADGRTLITGGTDGGIRWWDVATGEELRRLACLTGSPSGVRGLDLSPDGSIAAYQTVKPVNEEGEVEIATELWDLTARKKRLSRPDWDGLQFSPDGKTFFTSLWDEGAGFILSWDTLTGKKLRTVAKTRNFEHISLLSADGKLLAGLSDGKEKFIYVRDTATGKELCRVPAIPDCNPNLAISPDNKFLAVADGPYGLSDDCIRHKHIHLWDIATGKEINQFGRTTRGYGTATFSGDGKTLATAGEDNQIRLWETATSGERLHLSGHAGQINKLIVTDNDRTLISTSSDTTALVWDLTGTRRPTRAADRERSAPRPQELWNALADPDAAPSYRALCRLISAPADALALLRSHLKPVEGMDEKSIERLVANLDSGSGRIVRCN